MAPYWEVVGGADKGGIIIREGKDVKSPQTPERLSTGAIVEELELFGDRLHFRLLPDKGTGPSEGWASLKLGAKDLLVPSDEFPEPGAPAEEGGSVEVDEALKAKIEAMAKEVSADTFKMLVPKYKLYKFPLEVPKYRVFCFHNAGSAETNYSAKKTPFTDWIAEAGCVEFVALQYPGRENSLKEHRHTNVEILAQVLLSAVYDKIADGVPYCVWGHSVGTWVTFEFLILARKIGLPMPKAAFLNAFPAPHIPLEMRPWHRSRKLDEEGLKEELKNWDKAWFGGGGEMVFREDLWNSQHGPIMRADFPLFDEYRFKHSGVAKFDFPLHCWHMEGEHYNTAEMIQMWKDWTTADFDFKSIPDMGHLTCFYDPAHKKQFFTDVTALLKGYFKSIFSQI